MIYGHIHREMTIKFNKLDKHSESVNLHQGKLIAPIRHYQNYKKNLLDPGGDQDHPHYYDYAISYSLYHWRAFLKISSKFADKLSSNVANRHKTNQCRQNITNSHTFWTIFHMVSHCLLTWSYPSHVYDNHLICTKVNTSLAAWLHPHLLIKRQNGIN